MKIGYSYLCFCYELKDLKNIKKITNKKINIHYAALAKPRQVQEARKISDLVIVKSSDKNRAVFEHLKPDVIFSLEDSPKPDHIYFRNSGLNQVYCKYAKKNNIIIGISFDLILNSKNRVKILGRVMQNIRLCKKYKVPIAICSFTSNPYVMRNPSDLKSLGISLGMNTKQAKDCMSILLKRIKDNKELKKTGLPKGIKIID